jgi:hypothetical protein
MNTMSVYTTNRGDLNARVGEKPIENVTNEQNFLSLLGNPEVVAPSLPQAVSFAINCSV